MKNSRDMKFGCLSYLLGKGLHWFLINKEQLLTPFVGKEHHAFYFQFKVMSDIPKHLNLNPSFSLVAITQILEAITGSLIAKVNPVLALQSTWILNIVTAIIFILTKRGRPGMFLGTTPLIGLAMAELVEKKGVEYVYYSVMFAALLQIIFGTIGFSSKVFRFVPHSCIQGFANAMAVHIVLAQARFATIAPDHSFLVEHPSRNMIEEQVGYSWKHVMSADWQSGSPMIILVSLAAQKCF